MKKIAINSCFGGFGLSDEAIELYCQLSNKNKDDIVFIDFENVEIEDNKDDEFLIIKRDDEFLIKVIEQLSDKANGQFSNLKIVEIPDDVDWQIENYDGLEWIAEKHRIWR